MKKNVFKIGDLVKAKGDPPASHGIVVQIQEIPKSVSVRIQVFHVATNCYFYWRTNELEYV